MQFDTYRLFFCHEHTGTAHDCERIYLIGDLSEKKLLLSGWSISDRVTTVGLMLPVCLYADKNDSMLSDGYNTMIKKRRKKVKHCCVAFIFNRIVLFIFFFVYFSVGQFGVERRFLVHRSQQTVYLTVIVSVDEHFDVIEIISAFNAHADENVYSKGVNVYPGFYSVVYQWEIDALSVEGDLPTLFDCKVVSL